VPDLAHGASPLSCLRVSHPGPDCIVAERATRPPGPPMPSNGPALSSGAPAQSPLRAACVRSLLGAHPFRLAFAEFA
jgi:hypothetical protein